MAQFIGRFIAACWIAFIGYWAVSALSLKRAVESRGGAWRFVFALVIGGFLVLMHLPAFRIVAAKRLWPERLWLSYLADALALAGLIVLIWARRAIANNWSGAIVFREKHELVTSGPYAYVRHPIYSGLMLLMLGTALYWGSTAGFMLFVVISALFWYKSTVEERFMTEHFPEQYPAYMKRVKALIPWVF